MSVLERLEKFKSKKQLIEELEFYRSLINKKRDNKDFKTALEKLSSAITLIQEYEEDFDLNKEHQEFFSLKLSIESSLHECQQLYFRRYNSLLKENLTETNLESFTKLLAMLKEEIDDNLEQYLLKDLSDKINQYFKFINRVYVIVHTYKLLNYRNACQKILDVVKEIKDKNFPNLKALIFSIYQNLLLEQFCGFSKQCKSLSLHQLSNLLGLDSLQLRSFINLIMQSPESPIQHYNPITQEVIFKK